MHVKDVEDICMECNAVYSRLNDMHVEDVEDDNKEASRLYAELLLCVCWHTQDI